MPTYTFTGTATADTAEQAEALAKQQAEDEALLSQGAFVTQTSYNEVYVKLNNDDTYTVTFTLKVTDDAPTDSAGDIVQNEQAPTPTTPTNAQKVNETPPAVTSPPKLDTAGANALVSTSSIPGAVAMTTSALDAGNQNEPETSYIYRAIEVLSIFSKGQFIQEIQGAQIFFDVPETPNNSDATRNESTAATTATPASQADVRRVDNAIAARAANTESTVENRRAPQPGEENQDPMGTGDAAAIVNAAANGPATSNGQVVGATAPNVTGAVTQKAVSVAINLLDGTTTTVSTQDQINSLVIAGKLDFRGASGASVALQSLTAAQNSKINLSSQQLMNVEK